MPYVNIKVTREGVTKEQKEQLIAGATKLLQEVLGKNPSTTFVVIDEVETDTFICPICGKSFKTKVDLDLHIAANHKQTKKI